MKKNPKLLWIVGFLMIAAGIYLLVSAITPSGYKRAPGTVVNESTATGYKRDITFTGEDGTLYMGTDRGYSSDRRSDTPITVAYDPDNPEKTMRVVSDDGRTILWGSIITLLGIGLVYLGFRRPRPEDYGMTAGTTPSSPDETTRKMHTKKPSKSSDSKPKNADPNVKNSKKK